MKSFIMIYVQILATSIFILGCGTILDPFSVVTLASRDDIESRRVVANSYIVTFRGVYSPAGLGFSDYFSEFVFHYVPLADEFRSDYRIIDFNYITRVNLANPKDPTWTAEFQPPASLQLAWTREQVDIPGVIAEVNFRDNESAAFVLDQWEKAGRIWFAEPNYISELQVQDNEFSALKTAYTERAVWWRDRIKLTAAFEDMANREIPPHPSDEDIVAPIVAVLDSGVDVDHPLLKDRIWENKQPGQSTCSDDINGCDTTQAKKGSLGSGNVRPFALKPDGTCPDDKTDAGRNCSHGTHVAGVIAAKLDAESGVGGVCPVCKIMVIKIIKAIGGKGSASDSAILNGLKYLTVFKKVGTDAKAVRVANSSFGKYTRSRAVSLLVSILKQPPLEVLVVGAAGNEDSMLRVYPAALNDAVAVAAVGQSMKKAQYSNFGPWVDITAPGGDVLGDGSSIISTIPGGTGPKQGTSMAAPVVSGIAGLILSIDPDRSFSGLRASIVRGADPILYEEVDDNRDKYWPKIPGDEIRVPLLGGGMLDAKAAVDGTVETWRSTSALRRVDRGCGSMVQTNARGSIHLAWFALILPLVTVFHRTFMVRAT